MWRAMRVRPRLAITQAAQRLRRGEDALIPRPPRIAEIEVLVLALRAGGKPDQERGRAGAHAPAGHPRPPYRPEQPSAWPSTCPRLSRLAREGGSLRIFCLDLDGFQEGGTTPWATRPATCCSRRWPRACRAGLRGATCRRCSGGDESQAFGNTGQGRDPGRYGPGPRIIAEVGCLATSTAFPPPFASGIGAARRPCSTGSAEEAQAKADAALYEVGRAGKNTLRSAQADPPGPGPTSCPERGTTFLELLSAWRGRAPWPRSRACRSARRAGPCRSFRPGPPCWRAAAARSRPSARWSGSCRWAGVCSPPWNCAMRAAWAARVACEGLRSGRAGAPRPRPGQALRALPRERPCRPGGRGLRRGQLLLPPRPPWPARAAGSAAGASSSRLLLGQALLLLVVRVFDYLDSHLFSGCL